MKIGDLAPDKLVGYIRTLWRWFRNKDAVDKLVEYESFEALEDGTDKCIADGKRYCRKCRATNTRVVLEKKQQGNGNEYYWCVTCKQKYHYDSKYKREQEKTRTCNSFHKTFNVNRNRNKY